MSTRYYCKCGRTFEKNTDAGTTGYRLQDYGPGHECYGCPFIVELKDWYPKVVVKGYECRGSKYIRYDSTARLSVGDKCVGKIYSLDFEFLQCIKDYADSLEGIVADRSTFSSRPSDYDNDGRHILTVYPLQNKVGIQAKQLIQQRFFSLDDSRKDISPDQEKEKVIDTINQAREEAQALNTYFAPCGHKFNRSAGGAADVTIEVTGTAYSLGCFSCGHSREEAGDMKQGPKVFCCCTRKRAIQSSPAQVVETPAETAKRYYHHNLVYFVDRRENGQYTVFFDDKDHPRPETHTRCATIPDFPTQEQAENALDGYVLKNGFDEDAHDREETKTVGKLNLANISAGLQSVRSITENLDNLSHSENVSADLILPAEDNPYSQDDTPESIKALADSIQTNGQIHPLSVNKISEEEYRLISGERRLKAINAYLHWKAIPCMVYDHISKNSAKLKLHAANLEVRDYTTEQKLRFYEETNKLLRSMKESGEYTGPIQKGIAELLGVSDRQVRRYKTVTESLPEEQQERIMAGQISIDQACKIANSAQSSPSEPDETGRASGLSNPEPSIETAPSVPQEGKWSTENYEDCDHAFWDEKILCALKWHYEDEELFLYYLFQVPTTVEAAKDKLKPPYGYSGGTVVFDDKIRGDLTARSQKVTIEYGRKTLALTYSQIDAIIRHAIREGKWIEQQKAAETIKNYLTKGKGVKK